MQDEGWRGLSQSDIEKHFIYGMEVVPRECKVVTSSRKIIFGVAVLADDIGLEKWVFRENFL